MRKNKQKFWFVLIGLKELMLINKIYISNWEEDTKVLNDTLPAWAILMPPSGAARVTTMNSWVKNQTDKDVSHPDDLSSYQPPTRPPHYVIDPGKTEWEDQMGRDLLEMFIIENNQVMRAYSA